MSLQFSAKRLYWCLRTDMRSVRHSIFIAITTVAAVLFFWNCAFAMHSNLFHPHLGTYLALLFGGGLWVSSKTFSNLHHPQKGAFFLLLPASHLEKLLSRLLLSSVGYIGLSLCLYTIFYWLMHGLSILIFQDPIPPFNIADPTLWHNIGIYCVLQSMVLLASIYFKTHPLFKLALCLSGFLILAIPTFAVLHHAVHLIFWLVLAPLCWIISYIRLTESEI